MMNVYGADHHLLVLTDTIDADIHKHLFLQATISLQDTFEMEVEGTLRTCGGIVLDSNVSHRLDGQGQPLLLLLMDSTSTLAAGFKKQIGDRGYGVFPDEKAAAAAEFVRSFSHTVADSTAYNRFLTQLLELLGVRYVQPAMADPRVLELIGILKEGESDDHSVRYFAGKLGLSGSRLSHLFKEHTGIPLSGYILLSKLQKAIYLILNGMSITEAALTAGFDSPSHFAAASKRLLGMTPRDIRKDSVFLKVSYAHETV
ncbi:helix-turn-helix domain-containing protein [Paenibacillus sp. GCM10012303]|uniref:helix-turn-helix domain-containing protein n=1 Tax=Paenibacillus sp. GCM10012303 TaxID=3317340 RepID=UPI0036D25FF6